jgi:hypothetical protein
MLNVPLSRPAYCVLVAPASVPACLPVGKLPNVQASRPPFRVAPPLRGARQQGRRRYKLLCQAQSFEFLQGGGVFQ